MRVIVLATRNDTNVSSQSFILDLNTAGPFQPSTVAFDFAFGTGAPLDPTIAYYSVNQVHYYYGPTVDGVQTRPKNKTPLPIEPCGADYFMYDNTTQVQYNRIYEYMCITDKNYTLEGDFYSNEFYYLEVKMTKCANSTANGNMCQSNAAMDAYLLDT